MTDRDPYVSVADAVDDLPDLGAGESSEVVNHTTRNHRPETTWKYARAEVGDTPHGGKSPRVLDPEAPAPTVVVGDGKTDIHPEEPRMLSPREIARLQGFPDSVVFTPNSRRDTCRLVGNAVPVGLAESLGEVLDAE